MTHDKHFLKQTISANKSLATALEQALILIQDQQTQINTMRPVLIRMMQNIENQHADLTLEQSDCYTEIKKILTGIDETAQLQKQGYVTDD